MAQRDQSRYFIDGFSAWKGLIAIVAYPNALKGTDSEHTTFYTVADGKWFSLEFEFDGRSVTHVKTDDMRGWWLLGKRGEVLRLRPGHEPAEERIPGAGTGPRARGYCNRIAYIADSLYVCGVRRSVYTRRDGNWVPIDEGIHEKKKGTDATLEAIDGTSPDRIFAVGNSGEIWRYDGQSWHACDSPTNSHLNEVRCLEDGRVLAAGHDGTALVGDGTAWQVVHGDGFEQPLWGIEEFAGEVFVAGFDGIGKIVDNRIEAVDTGLGRVILGYRLRARDGILWSVGNEHLLNYDGRVWVEWPCPDN